MGRFPNQPNLRDYHSSPSAEGIPAGNEPGEAPEENSLLFLDQAHLSWLFLEGILEFWVGRSLKAPPVPSHGTDRDVSHYPSWIFPHFQPFSSSSWEWLFPLDEASGKGFFFPWIFFFLPPPSPLPFLLSKTFSQQDFPQPEAWDCHQGWMWWLFPPAPLWESGNSHPTRSPFPIPMDGADPGSPAVQSLVWFFFLGKGRGWWPLGTLCCPWAVSVTLGREMLGLGMFQY